MNFAWLLSNLPNLNAVSPDLLGPCQGFREKLCRAFPSDAITNSQMQLRLKSEQVHNSSESVLAPL